MFSTTNQDFEVNNMVVVDPVCKVEVDEKSTENISEYKGKKYYFCAPLCKKVFEEEPEKYAEK